MERDQVVLPEVQFLDDSEVDDPGIKWAPVSNVLMVSRELPPYVREIQRCADTAGVPWQIAQEAVDLTYTAEFQALIIDAKGQPDGTLADAMLSPPALYAKVLGMQALTDRVQSFVRSVAKAA